MGEHESANLRERNKARARAEIADAALRLFCDRSFDAVTVDEIVAAAGVSRRTFFRYFETKEDALLADYPELNIRLSEILGSIDPADPFDAIRQGLHRMADWYIERSDAVLARSRLIRDTAALHLSARNLEFFTRWERAISNAVAQQTGTEPGDLLPRTTAATAVAAFRAALTQWVRSSCADDLHVLTDRVLDLVEHGVQNEMAPLASPSSGPGPGPKLRSARPKEDPRGGSIHRR